ncbi:glycoside hydrolase family 16 protein [Paenibacillus alba]|uniref:Glycoside hydrolase family 16 protein n=1 Tax=Paenibacillus alba TaxID=1197127 RepID=A0ABU6G3G9_9BACL|nr:glycoside hydrolase family 16 protein [Paenibacillus alba]MEC0228711.1 glycoside hydrolase family 16 protein [Paenibacillus alba]
MIQLIQDLRLRFGLFAFALTACFLFAAHASAAPPSDDYVLKFEDNFNGSGLDTNEWMYRTGSRFYGNNKPENVIIVSDPVESSKQVLKMEFKKESDLASNGGVPYSNGGIISKNLYGYGYYEISAKLYGHEGLHTSFWNMGLNKDNSLPINNQVNEIDMFEIDGHDPTDIGTNLHYYVPNHVLGNPAAQHYTIADSSQAYHTYGFEWLPDKVRWYVDGVEIRTTNNNYMGPHGLQNLWLTAQQLTYDPNDVDESSMDANGVLGASYFDYFRYYQTSTDYKSDVMIAPYNSKLINNDSSNYTESSSDWNSFDLAYGYQDKETRYATNSNAWAKWSPNFAQAGKYEVFAWNPSYYQNQLKSAHYTVAYNGLTKNVYVDQSTAGQNWVSLGIYDFASGSADYVKVMKDGTSPANETLRTDSMLFVPVSNVIDYGSANYSETGTWSNSTSVIGWDDSNTRWISTSTDSAKYSPNFAASGWQDVYIWMPVNTNSSNKVKYTIYHNGVTDTQFLDQTKGVSRWVKLGSYSFASGASDYVKVENGNTYSGNVRTDTIKFYPTAAVDTTVPSQPTSSGLTVTPFSDAATGNYQLQLNWTANTESDLAGYNVYLSGTKLNRTPIKDTQYKIYKMLAQYTYNLGITAVDYSGNESVQRTFTGTTATDATAPTIPSGLTALAGGSGTVHLKVGVGSQGEDMSGYYYYMNGVKYNSLPEGGTYSITGLTDGTTYTFEVSAVDKAGNESAKSGSVAVTPHNQIISAYGDMTYRDNVKSGTWSVSTITPFIGSTIASNTTGSWLQWNPVLSAGAYEVFVWVPKASNGSASAKYTINTNASTSYDLTISQVGSGSSWVSLGSYDFSNTGASVKLQNAAGSGYIRANAVKFVPLEIDNDDVLGRYTETGTWSNETVVLGLNGSAARKSTAAGASASWTPSSLSNGYYEVFAWIPSAGDGTTSAKYTIYHNGKTDVVTKNQTSGGNAWVRLGSYDFAGGSGEYVKLENNAGSGVLRADAMKVMALPPAIVLDNGGTGYSELSGTWNNSGLLGYGGTGTRYSATTGASVKWQPTLSRAGVYRVFIYRVHTASNPDTSSDPNARIDISYDGGTDTKYVNYSTGTTDFIVLGDYQFAAGSTGFIQNTLNTAGKNIRADAVKFQLISPN